MTSTAAGYGALTRLFREWMRFLEGPGDCAFKQFYERVATGLEQANLTAALFNQEQFPSLYSEIPLAGSIDSTRLPTSWAPPAGLNLRDAVLTDLERLLIAYVWKRGELWMISHVLAGLRDQESFDCLDPAADDDEPAVMVQFGRHLAKPLEEPIFDQHTARHMFACNYLNERDDACLEQFEPARAAQLTSRQNCQLYRNWWRAKLLAPLTQSRQTTLQADLLWADRIMFSLGKAVAVLWQADAREERKRQRQSEVLPSR